MRGCFVTCLNGTTGQFIWNATWNAYPPMTMAFYYQLIYNAPVSLYVMYLYRFCPRRGVRWIRMPEKHRSTTKKRHSLHVYYYICFVAHLSL